MPGKRLPESFTPVLRLMSDSAKSPMTAANPRSKPRIVACVQVSTDKCPGISLNNPKLQSSAKPSAPKITYDLIRKRAKAMIPLGRAGSPEEAAGPVLFLASPLADYVTGHVVLVTGGSYM